jgi:hypothetical protein
VLHCRCTDILPVAGCIVGQVKISGQYYDVSFCVLFVYHLLYGLLFCDGLGCGLWGGSTVVPDNGDYSGGCLDGEF